MKYVSSAVAKAPALFQNQKVVLTALFCEWEVRGGSIQNLQIPFLNLFSIQEIPQHKARLSTKFNTKGQEVFTEGKKKVKLKEIDPGMFLSNDSKRHYMSDKPRRTHTPTHF